MKNRNLWLGGALAALLLLILLPKVAPERKGYPDSLAAVDTARVERVELAKGDQRTVLEKRNGLWRVTQPVDWAADRAAVDRLLGALADLAVVAKVQDNDGYAEDGRFQLDDAQALRLSVRAGGEDLLAARVGKASADFTTGFARYEDRPEIYRTAQNLGSRLSPQSSRWIDKVVYKEEPEQLAAVELVRADGTLRFDHRDSLWTVDWTPASGRGFAGAPVKDAELSALKNAAATLRMSDLADSARVSQLANAAPELTQRVTLADGRQRVIEWARAAGDDSRVYCRLQDGPTWFAVFKSTLDRFEKEPEAFRQED